MKNNGICENIKNKLNKAKEKSPTDDPPHETAIPSVGARNLRAQGVPFDLI